MSSRREPEHTNPIRPDPQFGRSGSDHSHSPLRVLQSRTIPWLPFARRHAILHQHRNDPDSIEPLTNLGTFQIPGQNSIASAWKHKHGLTRGTTLWSGINNHFRDGD